MKIQNYTIVLFLLLNCSSANHSIENSKNLSFENYITSHGVGDLGDLPLGCKIEGVAFKNDTVTVGGKIFDMQTGETVIINICAGSFTEVINKGGTKVFFPNCRESLFTTGNDGAFCIKYRIEKNDILVMEQIGYFPLIFKVYDYLIDTKDIF